jgi:hypothetical protein
MKISDLRQFEYIRDDLNVKVLRHMDSRLNLWELRSKGRFDHYQNGQAWDVFSGASYVISFIGERNRYARFVGVWRVISTHEKKRRGFLYRTKELPGFEDLEGRLIVDWGAGTRSWAQWLHRRGNKHIAELLPPNYVMDFPGYYNFTLTYKQLAMMVENPDSNREWQRMLSSVSGVYLLLDQRTGRQYVGSAYGTGGLWARWKSYVRSPSGGNTLLIDLLRNNPSRFKRFQFSIIRVLEPSATKRDVIGQEILVKKKLGCRTFGLNSN